MSDNDQMKRAAAVRAADWIRDGMILGLGTGSTVYFLLEEIAAARSRGGLKGVVGIPTSRRTEEIANRLGIPLSSLDEHPSVDLTIDGADEVDPELRVIKGLGGALLREKVVAAASETVVIVADASKAVAMLGTTAPLPVEVDPFAIGALTPFFETLGSQPRVRVGKDGQPLVTDGGHLVVDCRFPRGIEDPESLEARLNNRPGVLENGLFIGLVNVAVLAGPDGVQVRSTSEALS